MRIETVDIDGFGDFCERQIGPFRRPLTVIHGPNEAGKTTLLSFMRAVLFGFPRQGRDEFYPPSMGGRHGGRVIVQGDDGPRYVIERFAGVRGGSVRITASEGEQLEDGLLLRKLLGNASQEMFEAVFAFGLQELQNMKSLSQSDVSARIYSAGMGAATVPGTLAALAKQREEIFKPGGHLQPVATVLNELYQVDAKLDQAKRQAEQYGGRIVRCEKIEVELHEATRQVGKLSARKGQLERLQQAWADWVSMDELEKQLRELPALRDFPEDAIIRLDGAEERLRQATADLTEVQQEVAEAEKMVHAPIRDELMLEDEKAIEQMRRKCSSFDDSVRDLPERQAEIRGSKDEFNKALRELGSGWDEARLVGFDTSIQARDSVEQWRRRLEELERTLNEANADARRAKEGTHDAVRATAEARAAAERASRPEVDDLGLAERRAALRAARSQLVKLGLARQRREDLQAQLRHVEVIPASKDRPALAVYPILGLAGVGSVVIGVALAGAAAPFGIVLGATLAIIAAYLLLTSRGRAEVSTTALAEPLSRRLREATENEMSERNALQRIAAPFAAGLPDGQALDEIEAGLDKMAKMADGWSATQGCLEQAQKEEKRQLSREGEALKAAEKARTNVEAAHRDWIRWLIERGLAETLVPPTAATAFERVEAARIQLTQISKMEDRVAAIEKDITEFRSLVEPLVAKHGVPLSDESYSAVALAADAVIQRFAATQKSLAQREQANEKAKGARRRFEARKERAVKARVELDALLQAGGSGDPEIFRKKARQHSERQEAQNKQRGCSERLRLLSGPGEQYERFLEALGSTSLAELDEELSDITTSLTEAQEKLGNLREERGGVLREIEQLACDEETSAHRAKRAELIERLQVHARDWSALVVAQTLLERARSKYEAERQPAVIKHAQTFFEAVTGGRYRQLIAPLGTQTVTAVQLDGTAKTPQQLSRGTQEQLYLALRFGLIRQFGEQEVCLPVVVDEVLVNFDPERARHAAEAFAELARTNQVLVFTCHPSTVELFEDVDAEAEVIEISMLTTSGSSDTAPATQDTR